MKCCGFHTSISPFISSLGSLTNTSSGSGQFAGDPSRGKLQAPAGGVTGASPHIVKKNRGNISINLFIWKEMIVSNYVVYHNRNCDDKYSYHPDNTPNNQSRCLQSSDLLFLNQSAISSAP